MGWHRETQPASSLTHDGWTASARVHEWLSLSSQTPPTTNVLAEALTRDTNLFIIRPASAIFCTWAAVDVSPRRDRSPPPGLQEPRTGEGGSVATRAYSGQRDHFLRSMPCLQMRSTRSTRTELPTCSLTWPARRPA